MSIFNEVKKAQQASRRPITTAFKIESFEIDAKDPRKSVMHGFDMLNKDDSGVPKKMQVRLQDPSGKSMNINDINDSSNMAHTKVGGLLRLDGLFVKQDGSGVARHVQRIKKEAGEQVNGNGVASDVGFMKAWTKILPEKANGQIAEFEVNGKTISRGRALVVPEDSKSTQAVIGSPDFKDQLSKAVELSVNQAPDRTKPILLLRSEGEDNQMEVTLQTLKQNADNSYSLMTKEEILDAAKDNYGLKTFLENSDKYAEAGKTQDIEILSGHQLDLVGLTKDPRSGKPLDNPRVQSMAKETARYFAIPKQNESDDQQYEASKTPQYKLSVISYKIPKSDDTKLATLETLGSVPGQTASPDAGLSKTSNPYYPANGTQTQAAAAPEAQAQAAPAAQANGALTTQTTQAKTAAPAAAVAQAQPEPTPEEPPMQDDMDTAMSPEDMLSDDMMEDFDLDDLEEQLSSQGA